MIRTALTRLLAAGALILALPAQAELTKVSDFGPNPGSLGMYKYVPAELPAKAPLVVALHGCTQSPTDYDDEPGWLQLADRYKFAVLLPRQPSSNQDYSCFRWYSEQHQQRGQGEPQSIVSMVDKMIADHQLDPARVFISGLSGGGSMVPVMLATYPDRFAGGAIEGGVPYRCATDDYGILSCMSGEKKSAQAWGDLVRKAYSYSGAYPKVAIWHGTRDGVVSYSNLAEHVKQWTNVHGIDATPTKTETVNGHTHQVFEKNGVAVIEAWSMKGMDHGSAISPGDGPDQCGKKAQYALDVGVCGAYHSLKLWGVVP